jgi:UDPglucose--hexose-1-phosphate uridylyltransferase
MESFHLADHPHRRYNPLTGEWILVSPHRAKRPWQGHTEKQSADIRPVYDPACYLCPGNDRAAGKKNPPYTEAFSFVNDFSALLEDSPGGGMEEDGLFRAKSERGICKVICFSPRHDLTIPEMELTDIRKVVDLWQKEYVALSQNPAIQYVQVFENKGSIMGCSNPHPHGQIWASESVPAEPHKESLMQAVYYQKHGRSLLADYLAAELLKKERLLIENDHFVALVPFWAVWPFESMIISRRHLKELTDLNPEEKNGLAGIYKELTVMYDNLFEVSFPYSAGIHQAPCNEKDHSGWHFHMHFYPPLLRSASVKKFMVGYEMLANPQRDITPETSAAMLRSLPRIHFKLKD